MGAMNLAMHLTTDDDNITHDCILVAPPEAVAVAHTIGIDFTDVSAQLPSPPLPRGLVVCLPHFLIEDLPTGWTGVWARKDIPPPGAWIPVPIEATTNAEALGRAMLTAQTWLRERYQLEPGKLRRELALQSLHEIGIALSAERDPQRLLTMILSRARQLVAADAGSLYLVASEAYGEACIRLALAQNDSIDAPWTESLLPLSLESIVGSVAQSCQILVIDDAYALTTDDTVQHDRSFDERFGYHTKSIVGIPLLNRDNKLLGVLQLINRKPSAGKPLRDPSVASEVLPFNQDDTYLLHSLASLAAVSIEKSNLYEEINRLFEGFVHASVTAIEQRDPTTSGHSFRVAEGTLALAQRVERVTHGPWASVRFKDDELRELRYAALLHDFGKAGVREKVLTKSHKLYPEQLIRIEHRFLLAMACQRASSLEEWLYEALQDPQGMQARLPTLMRALAQDTQQLENMLQIVYAANQPNIIATGYYSTLLTTSGWEFVDPHGTIQTLLTDDEVQTLSIPRGSLTAREREEIESHVIHSYNFLQMIPWTRDLAKVPQLANTHHERMDGRGYPKGLPGDEIPLGARMMAIADIFDALTASDRPYRPAVPLEQALSIIEDTAQTGQLDSSLVQLWIESKAWEDIITP